MRSDGAGAWPHADAPRPVAVFGTFRFGPYYEAVLTGVLAAAHKAGGSVIAIQTSVGVMPSESELDDEEAVSRAAWDHFDGAIVILKTLSLDYVAQLRAAGKFVVAIGQELRGTEAAVTIDNVSGVNEAVTHLAEHGHTAIGFLAPTWHVDTAERYAAYREIMAQLGLTALPLIAGDLPPELTMDEQGYIAGQQFAEGPAPCTAVLVGTDRIALGFLRGLQEAGVVVPNDLAVVGIDDIDLAAVSVPPLASVAINFERVGEIACNVAMRGGRGEPVETYYAVPQRFVPRDSCGCINSNVPELVSDADSPVDVFRQALADAVREGALENPVDTSDLVRIAREVVAFLDPLTTLDTAIDKPTASALAEEINTLCTLDRQVQAALRAIRALADALVEAFPDPAWAIAGATLDLCDAIRAGQLTLRVAEYADLKRTQISHYFIGNSLLRRDQGELRSMDWAHQTPADVGALGLWNPAGQSDHLVLQGIYERTPTGRVRESLPETISVEAFPPSWMLREATGKGRLLAITQVKFEDSDWGVLAVAGGRALQSALIQETFQLWSILLSTSLDQEKADLDLARQAEELNAAYRKEMALIEEVRISEERYALAAEAAHDALWDWDIASGKVFYSDNWKDLLGYSDTEIGTSPYEWLSRIHPEDVGLVREQVTKALKGIVQYLDFEYRVRVGSGEYRWFACSGRSVVNDEGRPIRLVGSTTDVTARRLLQEQLLQEARFDGLTGLAKGPLFKNRLNRAFELSTEQEDYSFAVLFVDLDGFKAVNDSFGHAVGDELLVSVARRLQESLRRNDTAARLGGDEFAIILTDIDKDVELPLIIERIETHLRAPHQVGDRTIRIGAAIGVALSGDGDFSTADDMLHEADTAMYRAKRRNKQIIARSREVRPVPDPDRRPG